MASQHKAHHEALSCSIPHFRHIRKPLGNAVQLKCRNELIIGSPNVHQAAKSLIAFFGKFAYSLLVVVLGVQLGVAAPKKVQKSKTVNDKYAAIVMDAHSGKILYQQQANAKRYPASLTKMMTLYMVFEALQAGRISMKTPIPVSAYAAARPPTKIGFQKGQSIEVEAAAKALITRSANDVASALAEYLGGSEKKFAQMMTQTARRLGMKNTNFTNASGLPDVNNYTTARDMARLSLALRRDFPQYYKLFNTTSFEYRGQTINSHNRLVKTMKGVDGIKTGYVRMSGFNIASSMQSDDKSIVAVVMGGRSATSRDAHMRELLTSYIAKASKSKGNKNNNQEPELRELLIASKESNGHTALPSGRKAPRPILKIREDKSVTEKIGVSEPQADGPQLVAVAIPAVKPGVRSLFALEREIRPNHEGREGNNLYAAREQDFVSDREHDAALLTALATLSDGENDNSLIFDTIMQRKDPSQTDQILDEITTASMGAAIGGVMGAAVSNAKKGWVVEVAEAPTVREAELMLHKASIVGAGRFNVAQRYLKIHDEEDTRLYRARFAGFANKKAAYGACDLLKKADIDCLALKD